MTTWIERGSGVSSTHHRCGWLLIGPLVLECWRWWFRLGVTVGKWYVGVYLGPFVVTVGLRKWVIRPYRARWTLSAITVKKVSP